MHARVVTPAWAIAENNKVYHDTNLGSWLLKSGVWIQSHMQEEKKARHLPINERSKTAMNAASGTCVRLDRNIARLEITMTQAYVL